MFAPSTRLQLSTLALRRTRRSQPNLPCAPAPAVPGQSVLATVRADYTPLLHLRIMPHLGVWKLVAAVEEHPHAQPDEAQGQEEGSQEKENEKHKKLFTAVP